MVYDTGLAKLVLFGGATGVGKSPQFAVNGVSYMSPPTVSSHTWTFNGTTWSQLSPSTFPSARSAGAASYDQQTGTVLLFGGYSSTGTALGDTWSFNGTTWSSLSPFASPTARSGGGHVV
jgi:hypothetical protein